MEQTHRHSFIASLLGIKHLVVCVNKMDLVDFAEDRYREITQAFSKLSHRDSMCRTSSSFPSARCSGTTWWTPQTIWPGTTAVPCSIISKKCMWEAIGTCKTADSRCNTVIRPQLDDARDFRGYAGRMASGIFKVGDEIVALARAE